MVDTGELGEIHTYALQYSKIDTLRFTIYIYLKEIVTQKEQVNVKRRKFNKRIMRASNTMACNLAAQSRLFLPANHCWNLRESFHSPTRSLRQLSKSIKQIQNRTENLRSPRNNLSADTISTCSGPTALVNEKAGVL